MLKELIECKQSGTTKVFKNFHSNVLSWDEFIQIAFNASRQEPEMKEVSDYDKALGGKIHGNILIKEDLYLYILADSTPQKCKEVINKFAADNIKLGLSNYYINLSGQISDIKMHNDFLDNFYWQCQGVVEWIANEGQTYRVEPGDLVYIPSKTIHAVKFLNNPRGSVGFATDLSAYV